MTRNKQEFDNWSDKYLTIKSCIVEMEKEAMTSHQWRLMHKLKYYIKKYETEINQIELDLVESSPD